MSIGKRKDEDNERVVFIGMFREEVAEDAEFQRHWDTGDEESNPILGSEWRSTCVEIVEAE